MDRVINTVVLHDKAHSTCVAMGMREPFADCSFQLARREQRCREQDVLDCMRHSGLAMLVGSFHNEQAGMKIVVLVIELAEWMQVQV